MSEYTRKEIMAISAGRLVNDGDILFAGTGLSMLAATVAKHIYAPSSVVFFETGGIDPSLHELPLAVADPRVMSGTCLNTGLVDAFAVLGHRRLRTIAFLGAAQIDPYGNLNSTCLGDYQHPSVRFPGCGGALDAASLASGVIIFMAHEKKRFVNQVDYLSSPGWLAGGDSRAEAGFRRGGPLAVVTDLGVMRFEEKTKHMYLEQYYPGVEPEQVQENTGFELDLSRAREAEPPNEKELTILRRDIDPLGLILG